MAETLSAASESDDDSDQSVSIHKAAKHCNVSQLRRALAAGVSPNSTNHAGQPLIIVPGYLILNNCDDGGDRAVHAGDVALQSGAHREGLVQIVHGDVLEEG